jgi:hypothetical protein
MVIGKNAPGEKEAGPEANDNAPLRVVIRAGDRVMIEERTAVAVEQLEAIAMEPAVTGAVIEVRMAVGGACVRVIVCGPGRAEFAAENEGWR